jgi:hypothetical protein
MTFTLNYTNTLQDYVEANRHHSGGARRRLWFIVMFCLFIVFLSMLFSSPTPVTPPPPGPPAPVAPLTGSDLLLALALQIVPYVLVIAFVAVVFVVLTKSPRKRPPARLLKPVAPRRPSLTSRVPTYGLLIVAACAFLTYIVIDIYFNFSHADGSPSARSETVLRFAPWPLILAAIMTAASRRGIKNGWLRQTQLQLPQLLTLTEDSVTVQNSNVHSIYQWHAFNQCRDTAALFMLYISGLSFFMIPKRALESPEQIDAFRAFIHSHILPPSSGFPVLPAAAPPAVGPTQNASMPQTPPP